MQITTAFVGISCPFNKEVFKFLNSIYSVSDSFRKMHSFLVFLFRTPPSLVEYVMQHPEEKRNINMFESLDIQTAAEVRYLDP